jgi:hypothetical protein
MKGQRSPPLFGRRFARRVGRGPGMSGCLSQLYTQNARHDLELEGLSISQNDEISRAIAWPLWCERRIEAAEFVLMVCTESYHLRVKGDEQPGQGLGVVWEAGIIRQLLYDAGALSDKFVPVLFSDGVVEYVPTLIRGRTRYVVDTEDGYERLLRQLSGQPSVVRPVLGPMPPLPARPRQWPADEPPPASATPPGERTVTASGAGSVAVGGGAGGATIVTGSYNTDGKGAR